METIENNTIQQENITKEEIDAKINPKKQFLFSADNGIGIFAVRGLKNHFRTNIEISDNADVLITKGSGRYAKRLTKIDKWQISKTEILSIHKARRTQGSLLAVAALGIFSGVLSPIFFLLTILAFFGLFKKAVFIQLKNGKDIWFYYKDEDTLSAFISTLEVNFGNMRKSFNIYSPTVAAIFLGLVLVISSLLISTTPAPTTVSTPSTSTSTLQTPEQFMNSCRLYTYDEVARKPNQYIGKPAFITGAIVQTIESDESDSYVEMRIDVEEGSDTIFYVTYNRKTGEDRFLEGDYVIVYGIMDDLITYESVQGAKITIPAIQAKYIEFFDGNRPY